MFCNFNAGGGDHVENLSYVAIRYSSCTSYVDIRRLTTNAPPAPHRAHILQTSVHLRDTLSLPSSGIMNTRKSSNNGGSGVCYDQHLDEVTKQKTRQAADSRELLFWCVGGWRGDSTWRQELRLLP